MGVHRKWLSLIICFLGILHETASAQALTGTGRGAAGVTGTPALAQLFLPISPGSPDARLQWPRPGASYRGSARMDTFSLLLARTQIKTAPTKHVTPPVKRPAADPHVSPRASQKLQNSLMAPRQDRSSSSLWKLIGLTGAIILLLLSLWRLLRLFATPSDAPAVGPLSREFEQVERTPQPAPRSVDENANQSPPAEQQQAVGAIQSAEQSLNAPPQMPPQPGSIQAPLAEPAPFAETAGRWPASPSTARTPLELTPNDKSEIDNVESDIARTIRFTDGTHTRVASDEPADGTRRDRLELESTAPAVEQDVLPGDDSESFERTSRDEAAATPSSGLATEGAPEAPAPVGEMAAGPEGFTTVVNPHAASAGVIGDEQQDPFTETDIDAFSADIDSVAPPEATHRTLTKEAIEQTAVPTEDDAESVGPAGIVTESAMLPTAPPPPSPRSGITEENDQPAELPEVVGTRATSTGEISDELDHPPVQAPPVADLAQARTAAAWERLRDKGLEYLLRPILSRAGAEVPDRLPLYAYSFEPEEYAALEAFLRRGMKRPEAYLSTGVAFVFWAAEHIRAHYPRSGERQLTWAFLFDAFGLPEDARFAHRLVSLGLAWWGREIRQSENSRNLYLYSLLVEGGLPDALLQDGHYRRVILALVADIEKQGGARAASTVVTQSAQRRLMALPQTFQSGEFVRLLAEFGQALVRLRAAAPADLPPENIENWLATHHANWARSLPLRVSAETVQSLIVPALRIEREAIMIDGPLVTRELRRDMNGRWHGHVSVADQFWLPAAFLPQGQDLRLRLIPGGALVKSAGAPHLFAAPERSGWRAQLSGRSGSARLQLSEPVVFSAFADGRLIGNIELDSGVPDPADAVSLWRPAEISDGFSSDMLTLSPSERTRAPYLWALAPTDVRPVCENGLRAEGPEPAAGGALWRVTGKGALTFGDRRLMIETASPTDEPETRLVAFGATLPGWKIARRGGLVFLGLPTLCGQRDGHELTALSSRCLEVSRGWARSLGRQTVAWVENGETLCRLSYVSLPAGAVISVRETAAGAARLTLEGLGAARLQATAWAGDAQAQATLVAGACEIALKTAGATPGEISLQLSDPTTGAALELVAPWPARSAMLLDGKGARLDRPCPVAAESLVEWRAIVPSDMQGDLQIALQGAQAIILPVTGETPLGAHLTLIRTLLAQGGPDARVNVSLVVGGIQSPRLEVGRYTDIAVVQSGVLRVGLDRDAPPPPETALAAKLERPRAIGLHVTNLREGTARRLEAAAPCDLRALLAAEGGPWIIQARLEGRPQRAVFFSLRPSLEMRRDDRIASYAQMWRALAQEPRDPKWTQQWKLIEALAEGGDAGCADQVQALAEVPEALVMLSLRVSRNTLATALGLDLAAPIFWPALPVAAFVTAVRSDYARRRDAFLQIFDEEEAKNNAISDVLSRIGDILARRPELGAHFGRALTDAGLIDYALSEKAQPGLRESLVLKPLGDLAMKAAQRFDRLPYGLKGVAPLRRPPGRIFDTDTQTLVDAPIVTAEIAAGLRVATRPETLMLIGLRLLDPEYFDRAVPAALAFYLETTRCAARA